LWVERKIIYPVTLDKVVSGLLFQLTAILITIKLKANLNASNMSLYDVTSLSLSNTPSLSTAVLNAVISLSKL
jgi:hypothetical protein